VFAAFESLDDTDRRRFQLARRIGIVRNPGHLELLSNEQRSAIDEQLSRLDTDEKFEGYLRGLLRRYI